MTIDSPKRKTLVVILGATATGKTDIGIRLAQAFHSEIISSDSRQIYREMSIGTAKPTAEELATVPHHFIGTRSVTEDYSAGRYEEDALQMEIWLDGENAPVCAEIFYDGRRIVTMTIENFQMR